MKTTLISIVHRKGAGYLAAVLGIAVVTALGAPVHGQLDDTIMALVLLVVVLVVATLWGRGPGMVTAVLGTLSYNCFRLPTMHALYSIDSFTMAQPQTWIALAAFFITASTVGHLSITAKRRAAEAEVERQAARLASAYNRSLIEASLDPLVTIGLDGKITDVNAATETVTGHSRLQLIGTDFSDYFTDPEQARAGYQQAFRDGFVRDLALELRHRDGHITSVLYNASVYRDDSGRVLGVFAAARDITERKRAEEALRESESNLRRAQEVAHIGSWYLDIPHNRLTWSDEVFRIFGVPIGTALTYEAFLATVHPDDRDAVEQAWTAALHGAPYDIEHRIVVGGAVRWVRERAEVEFDRDGHPVEGIGIVQDITERKRAEEEIRALNAELEQRVMARTAELQAANALKDELLRREQAATAELAAALKREREIGFEIQQTLLLDHLPMDALGLRVAALTIPSQQIDGDFYYCYKHRHQCLDLIVADVMGKGIPAALLGAATKSHFLEALCHLMAVCKNAKLPEPKDIVTLAHAEMVQHLIALESFVTLCYARLDVDQRRLDVVDCGHTGIIHFHAHTDLWNIVYGDNLPLGIRPGELFDQISVPLEPGDLLLFYSDGITETRNTAGDLFGVERLVECVQINRDLEPESMVEAIRKAVFAFSESDQLSDDLTCVAIRVGEQQPPLRYAEIDIRSDLHDLRRARAFVRAVCRDLPSAPLDADSVAALELAVNEAASNIMKHAYHGRADQWIHLEAEAFSGKVTVRLYHQGEPFDPSTVAPPALDGSQESGFGMYLIAQSVDDVRYARDAHGRSCVALVKVRKS
ncbi:MAG TPA: SpoIIE family protein phosphatase [Alphaproteobacteria bacterium]|nr:SpoIIE family protein phosphatase [Alphaproteobacteria bacterium]